MIVPTPQHDIRIGTLVPGRQAPTYIPQILAHGFESCSLTFSPDDHGINLKTLAKDVRAALGDSGVVISSLGVYGNPLGDEDRDHKTVDLIRAVIESAPLFGAPVVAGFTGRVREQPIPKSIVRFREVWTPLAELTAKKGLRVAFENCSMGGDWNRGDWNIAHNPDAWALMFDAVPSPALGLQWEPCHQMVALIDPMPQLRKWGKRIFHVHGKDATIRWDVVREHGIAGNVPFAFHRTPSFGDSNWSDIISELRMQGFRGSIDIEGWHDPVYRGELEMTGQVHALEYLKRCRGGTFAPNPD